MVSTENFRKQHGELLEIVTKLTGLLNPLKLRNSGKEARTLLSQLTAKIGVHLSMEDKYLYPELVGHTDNNVQTLANRFIAEMGTLQNVFNEYVRKWPSQAAIEKGPEEFIKETKVVFAALGKRINREESELYALCDKLIAVKKAI